MKSPYARSADTSCCQWVRLLMVPLFGFMLASCGADKPSTPELAVRAFLESYFSTWSKQDMEGYGRHFHESARVTYVDNKGQSHTDGLSDFLFGQKMGHQTSPEPMKEVPEQMSIQMHDHVVQAQVKWRLTKGATVVTGTDFFTLIRTGEGWRIINLVFNND